MTALEEVTKELKRLRDLAIRGGIEENLVFAKYALACWPTINSALEELQKNRIV